MKSGLCVTSKFLLTPPRGCLERIQTDQLHFVDIDKRNKALPTYSLTAISRSSGPSNSMSHAPCSSPSNVFDGYQWSMRAHRLGYLRFNLSAQSGSKLAPLQTFLPPLWSRPNREDRGIYTCPNPSNFFIATYLWLWLQEDFRQLFTSYTLNLKNSSCLLPPLPNTLSTSSPSPVRVPNRLRPAVRRLLRCLRPWSLMTDAPRSLLGVARVVQSRTTTLMNATRFINSFRTSTKTLS